MWSFDTEVRDAVIQPFDVRQFRRPSFPRPRGSTHLYETILKGVRRLRENWNPNAVNALVILTDGGDNGSRLDGVELPRELDPSLKNELLEGKLGPGGPGEDVHVLVTAAYAITCDKLLKGIDRKVFKGKCFEVDDASTARGRTVQEAYNCIRAYFDQLAQRPGDARCRDRGSTIT